MLPLLRRPDVCPVAAGHPAVLATVLAAVLLAGCAPDYDTIIRGGTVYDGSGAAPVITDIGIRADTIAAVGDLASASAAVIVDATDRAVSPGFINMLSWATSSLIQDGRGLSDIMQGVTLEVFGEGWSEGPLTEAMRADELAGQNDIQFPIPWTTLGEYLSHLEELGVSPNVASFVGATTVRIHELGHEDRAPTDEELDRMRALVRRAMEEGALGVGSSLIYTPAFFASTEELIALAEVAAEFDGMYITHMRSEGDRLLEAVDETIRIAREAGIRAEIYHLKAAGQDNWAKLDLVIERIEAARAEGLGITADMYTYTAGATGLDAGMPPWVQEGGFGEWRARLMDPEVRPRVAAEMRTRADDWENLLLASGADGALITGFREDSLRYMIGLTIAEVAAARGITAEEAAMDLVVADSSRVSMVYFLMSEDNVRRQIQLPWMAFDSDAGALAPEQPFTNTGTHPRAYGNFARLLGRYVRDEGLIPLEEAVRRLTSFPAENLRLVGRGTLAPGNFADVVVFDPAVIADRATFEDPHQLSVGVEHVFVNGGHVVRNGRHTDARPGRFLRRGQR